jgi:hypothetical protein
LGGSDVFGLLKLRWVDCLFSVSAIASRVGLVFVLEGWDGCFGR